MLTFNFKIGFALEIYLEWLWHIIECDFIFTNKWTGKASILSKCLL